MAEKSFSGNSGREMRANSRKMRVPAGIRRVENRARPRSLVWRTSNAGGTSSVSDSSDVSGVSYEVAERAVEGGMLAVAEVALDG